MQAQRLLVPGPIESAPLRAQEAARPALGPDELLLDIVACAVCRTDLQIIEGDLNARRLPVVPGHQAVGRVAAVGSQVSGWDVGDRAGIGWLASTCGTCRYCRSERENLCKSASFTGWDCDGGYAEQASVRAEFALRLPGGPALVEVAPLLCGGVIGYRSLKRSGIQPGGRLGLYGFGASALLAIQVARHWGCETFVATRSEPEQARALELGAAWAGGYDEDMPGPIDAAVTFAPAGWVVVAALRALAPGGTVAINAIHLDRIPDFDYGLLWGERALVSVANYTRADAADFLRLVAEIPIRTMVEQYPLEEATTALARLKAGETQATAVLVTGS